MLTGFAAALRCQVSPQPPWSNLLGFLLLLCVVGCLTTAPAAAVASVDPSICVGCCGAMDCLITVSACCACALLKLSWRDGWQANAAAAASPATACCCCAAVVVLGVSEWLFEHGSAVVLACVWVQHGLMVRLRGHMLLARFGSCPCCMHMAQAAWLASNASVACKDKLCRTFSQAGPLLGCCWAAFHAVTASVGCIEKGLFPRPAGPRAIVELLLGCAPRRGCQCYSRFDCR